MLREDCALLRCPYCGSGFRIHSVMKGTKKTVEYGTLVCACDEFPVVEGIVYLLRDRAKYIVQFLQENQPEQALQWAMFQSGIARRVLPSRLIRRLRLSGVNRFLKPIHDVSYYENRLNEPESLLIFLA